MRAVKFRVVEGDITTQDVGTIVNAANNALQRGGGVDGAIHAAAGPELQSALDRIGGCPTGACVITPGFGLIARHIIHCVGPVWRGGHHDEDALLASCYRSALALAADRGCRSIAFPAISTGVYGFPPERAASLAVATVVAACATQQFTTSTPSLDEVRFVCFDHGTAALYHAALGPARLSPDRGSP